MAEVRVQRRRDDENMRVVALGAGVDLVPKALAADGLVRDHEDAALVRPPAAGRHGLARQLDPARPRDVHDARQGQAQEHDDPRPRADHERCERNRGEIPHRQQQKAVGLGFAAERIDHLAPLAGCRSRPAKPGSAPA